MKWVKIYQIWYIEGDFWGVFGCGVYILEHKMGMWGYSWRALTGSLRLVSRQKVAEEPKYSAKMAHLTVFSPVFA
nr:MAG TPA: hypothetical protein [Caudoviricetes sp.]